MSPAWSASCVGPPSSPKEHGDPSKVGGIPLDVVHKYMNYWFSYSLDLFGSEVSTNAADFFASGLKGRWHESRKYDEHKALHQTRTITHVEDGKLVDHDIPLRNAMNEVLREEYANDVRRVARRWNKALADEGVDFRIELPSTRFHRRQGIYAGHHFDPQGNPIDEATWNSKKDEWLPTDAERAYVQSLMKPVLGAGQYANYIAPPRRGINKKGTDFEYVRTDG